MRNFHVLIEKVFEMYTVVFFRFIVFQFLFQVAGTTTQVVASSFIHTDASSLELVLYHLKQQMWCLKTALTFCTRRSWPFWFWPSFRGINLKSLSKQRPDIHLWLGCQKSVIYVEVLSLSRSVSSSTQYHQRRLYSFAFEEQWGLVYPNDDVRKIVFASERLVRQENIFNKI